MNSRLIVLIIAIFCVLLFSGCIDQKLTIENKIACINLTSRSFAFVPECSSIEECFSRVEDSFNFPQHLSPRVSQKLFSYKNLIASSWLYFNEARKSIDAIHKICSTEKDLASLPTHLNTLSNALSKAFAFANSANKLSFSILLLEKQVLSEAEVELIKEEELFSDFVLIQNNLNEFSENTIPSSDSYFSHYSSVLQKFNSLSEKFGFKASITEEYGFTDLLEASDDTFLNELEKQNKAFYIPLLSDIVGGFITYLNNSFKLAQGVSVLENMPAFDFLQHYSELVGEKNSVFSHFVSILKNISLHMEQILARNAETIAEINSLITQTQQLIDSFSSPEFAEFDKKFLNELYALLEEQTISFSSNSFKVSQVSEIKTQAQKLLDELSINFTLLLNDSYLGKVSLGKKTSELKLIKNSLEELLENIKFLKNNSLENLLALCEKRISIIKEQLPKNFPTPSNQKIINSFSKLSFAITQFNSASEILSSLWYCKLAITEFNSLSLMLKDMETFENQVNLALQDCSSFLEKAFSSTDPQIKKVLSPLKNQWTAFLNQKNSSTDISLLSSNCSSLEEQVRSTLNSYFNANEIEKNFSSSQDSINKLSAINSFFPELFPSAEFTALEEQFKRITPFFVDSKISWNNSLQNISEFEEDVEKVQQSLKKTLKEKLVLFLQKTAKFELFPSKTPELNTDQNFLVRISFKNPFQSFDEPISFSIPFSSGNISSFLKKSPNISNALFLENKLLFELASLPAGETFIEFYSTQSISSKESLELVSFSAEKALLKKTILIDTNFSLPKLKISTKYDPFSCTLGKVTIYSKEKTPTHFFENDSLTFFDKEVFPNKKIEIYFELLSPLEQNISLKDTIQLDINSFVFKYSFSLQNKLPFNAEKQKIPLNISLEKNSVISLSAFDSLGNKFSVELGELGKPLLLLPFIGKNQVIEGELWVKISSTALFWKNLLHQIEQNLESSPKTSNEIKEKYAALSKKLSSLKQFPFSETNLKELQSLENQANELKQKEKENTIAIEQFLSLKEKVKSLIEKFSNSKELFAAFPKNAASINSLLNTAFNKYSQAENLFSKQHYKEANSLLSEAFSLLSSPLPSTSLITIISEKTDSLLKDFSMLSKLGIDLQKLNESKEKITSLETRIRSTLLKGDFSEAQNLLEQFFNAVKDFNSLKDSEIALRTQLVKEKIIQFLSLLEEPEFFPLLEKELDSVSEKQLIKAKYLLPLQKKDFERIKTDFLKTKQSNTAKKAKELLVMLDDEQAINQIAALQEFLKLEPKIDTLTESLSQKKQSASNAYNKIKSDAAASLEIISSANLSEKFSPLLNRAWQEFDKQNFLKSIAITGMLSAAELTEPDKDNTMPILPFSVIPIITALCFFIILKIKKKRRKKEPVAEMIVPSSRLTV